MPLVSRPLTSRPVRPSGSKGRAIIDNTVSNPAKETQKQRQTGIKLWCYQQDLDTEGSKLRTLTVGNYMLGEVLGEGSFGKVRVATHVETREKVAVKILEKARLIEAADIQRVAREIKILKQNKHRNIIRLFEVLDTPGAIYLIMENADAGEMFNYIVKHKRVNENQACFFFRQIVDGVDYLHSMEVSHRDLKPENVLLQTSGRRGYIVKIVDFGLSNMHDGGQLLSTACGSPCYAAPEMIAGMKYWGPKADIWSMGIILYALTCGYLPFEDSNTPTLYKKILAGAYLVPVWISDSARDLISRILNTDPVTRYSMCDIRKHPWCARVTASNVSRCDARVVTECIEKVKAGDSRMAKDTTILLDEHILVEMQVQLDIPPLVVAKAFACNAHNNVTTTYHLLAQRQLRLDGADVGEGRVNNKIPLLPKPAHAVDGASQSQVCAAVRRRNMEIPPNPMPAHAGDGSSQREECTQESYKCASRHLDTRATIEIKAEYAQRKRRFSGSAHKSGVSVPEIPVRMSVPQTGRPADTKLRPVSAKAGCAVQVALNANSAKVKSSLQPHSPVLHQALKLCGSAKKMSQSKMNALRGTIPRTVRARAKASLPR